MTLYALTLSLILSVFVHAQNIGHDEDRLQNVRSLYRIEGNTLINFEGKVFSKIPFKDELEEDLSYKLKDPIITQALYQAFETDILPSLNESSLPRFKRALLQVCQLYGTKAFEKGLAKALVEEGLSADYLANWNRFILDPVKPSENPTLKIALITTSTSGGNLSVAKAVKAYLDLFPKVFDVIFIDYETYAGQYDPIKIATGAFTVDNIYRLLQQQNSVEKDLEINVNVLISKDLLCRDAAKFIPNRTAEMMKVAIKDLEPDLIISTRNYYADDFNLVSLGIPFRMLNCDHDICFFHQDMVGRADPQLVKFWIPSSSPRFFKTFFDRFHQRELFDLSDDWETLISKIAFLTHSSFSEIEEQFEVIGYPIRLEFERITDQNILGEFKAKWDLKPDEKAIIVEMGANGVGVIENIFNTLKNSPPHSVPIKYYFVCGRNEEVRKNLEKEHALDHTALKRCKILGYVEAEEKNELMNIASLMISKPGGSTQAELTELHLPLFMMHIHSFCEVGNKEKLLADQLAYEYDPTFPLTDQIEEVLIKAANTPITAKDPDWKRLIFEKLLKIKSLPQSDCSARNS